MIIALFVIAAVVSMPLAAVVVVSIASHREDAAWSLDKPAPGLIQAVARRLLDFHTEDPAWPVPKNAGQARPAAPAPRPAAKPVASAVPEAPAPAASSQASIRTAA